MADSSRSTTLGSRRSQMFPVLDDSEIAHMSRFGVAEHHEAGDVLCETGKPSRGMYVVLSGLARVTGRDGHGHNLHIAELRRGSFSAEIGLLSGKPAFVDGKAIEASEMLVIPPERLRALLIAEAELGEKIMRALILRRDGLIETGAGGPVLVGVPSSPDMARLTGFLSRNGIPHVVMDAASDPDARVFL